MMRCSKLKLFMALFAMILVFIAAAPIENVEAARFYARHNGSSYARDGSTLGWMQLFPSHPNLSGAFPPTHNDYYAPNEPANELAWFGTSGWIRGGTYPDTQWATGIVHANDEPNSYNTFITTGSTTLRAGPGTSYASIGTLSQGTDLYSLDYTSNGWQHVMNQAGTKGYVSDTQLKGNGKAFRSSSGLINYYRRGVMVYYYKEFAEPSVSFSPNSRDWGNTNVSVSVSLGSNAYANSKWRIRYSTNGGTSYGAWSGYQTGTITSLSFTDTGSHRAQIEVVNVNGTTATFASGNYNIDKTAPVITANTSSRAWGNSNASVTLTYADPGGSGLSTKQYAWSTSTTVPTSWTNYSSAVTQTGEGTWYLHARATDGAGNVTTTRFGPYRIDKTAPTITANTSSRAWGNSNVSITLTHADTGGSALSTKQYAWSTSTSTPTSWTNYSSAVTQTGEGTWYLHARATDGAGNVKTAQFGPYRIDKTAPAITLTPNTTNPTNQNVSVTATVSDAVGVAVSKWALGSQTVAYFSADKGTELDGSFIATANGVYTVYAKDTAGNETIKTINITNIDKVAPAITLTPNTTNPTNQNVSVTATVSDAVSVAVSKWALGSQTVAYFSADKGTELDGSFIATANGVYTVYAKDTAGNETIKTINITNIDKVAPAITLTPNTTNPTNQNVSVTATVSDAVGVAVSKWALGSQTVAYFSADKGTELDGSFIATANGVYTVYAKDTAGNETIKTINITNIDKVAPAITLTPNTTNPTNQNVSVTATVSDAVSVAVSKWAAGEQDASFFADKGTKLDGSFIATANGVYTVYAKDTAGNETIKTINITNIDKVAPTITANTSSRAWGNTNVSVTLTHADSGGSALSTKQYAWSTSTTVPTSWTNYSSAATQTGNGTWYLHARATDGAGNVTTKQFGPYRIDKVAPAITLTPNTTNPTNQNVSVTATVSDAVGVAVSKWALGSQNVAYFSADKGTELDGSFIATANGVYTVYAKDTAGNETIKTINITNIDKVAPAITLTPNTTNPTNQNVSVTATVSDAVSVAVSKWAAGEQDASFFADKGTKLDGSFIATANGVYTVYAKDTAGNETIKTINITNIDKVAPTITANTSSRAWGNTNVSVTLTHADSGGSALSTKQYAWSTSTTVPTSWTNYSSAATQTGNGTWYLHARATDGAGNVTTKQFGPYRIDKVAPAITLTPNTTNPTNQNVSVTATVSDAVGVAVSKWALGSQNVAYFSADKGTELDGSFIATANGVYTVYAKDTAGNETIKTINITNIDKVAPTITANTSSRAWGNTNVSVTLTHADSGGSALSTKQYAWSTSTTVPTSWTNYSSAATQTGNGTWYLHARATDGAGNVTTKQFGPYRIDKVAPAITLTPNTTNPTNQNVSVTATVSDAVSVAVSKWAAGEQDASFFADKGTKLDGSFIATANGVYTVYAKDTAGNETIKTINITNIDKVAPAITLTPNTTNPTNQNVSVTATVSDAVGVAVSKWALGSQNVAYFSADKGTELDGSFIATANGVYTVYAKDTAGNETIKTINITNIDKVAPAITLTPNTTNPTNQNVSVTATVSDAVSVAVSKWAAGEQDASFFADKGTKLDGSFIATANGVYTVYAKDTAGNETIKTINITNIDKVAPVINLTLIANETGFLITTQTTDQSAVVSIKWATGERELTYFKDNGTPLQGSFLVMSNGIYTVYAKDVVGNEAVKTISVDDVQNIPEPIISADTSTKPIVVEINYAAGAVQKLYRLQRHENTFTKLLKASGLASTAYAEGDWLDYTGPITVEYNSTLEAKSIDANGIESEVASYEITNLNRIESTGQDNVSPLIPIEGTIYATEISVTHPITLEWNINPNNIDNEFTAAPWDITNNSRIKLDMAVTGFELTDTSKGLGFSDVLPTLYTDEQWRTLGSVDTASKLALGIKRGETAPLWAAEIDGAKNFGTVGVAETTTLDFMAKHGLAFNKSQSITHDLVLLFTLN